jgi:acyl-CoA dehydrogenase
MNFDYTDKVKDMRERLLAFMDEHIYPNEGRFFAEIAANRAKGNAWIPTTLIEELKPKARAAGLWNLFLPSSPRAPEGLTNLEYAPLCEIMGRVPFAAEVFNCSAPDTGNMETLERYASESLKDQWLEPLLKGEFRSAFLMTEPMVASSDATNIQCSIVRDGDEYVINGLKWWSSGAGDPRCAVYIVMGKTNTDAARHSQQSMIVVPSNAKGITVVRPLSVFGYDDAPHGHMEVRLKDVRVPVGNKVAKAEIAMIKVVAPNMACDIIDMAIQAHGGGGVSDDFPLAYSYANQRTLRLADGPDEVHRQSIAKLELAKHMAVKTEMEIPVTRGC